MIVVFDAECLMCSRSVAFLLQHDGARVFRFASIQSAAGAALVTEAGLEIDGLETMLLLDGDATYRDTAALLRIVQQLGWPWRLAWVAWLIPAPLRDAIYRLVARHRYRLFGRRASCFVPPLHDRERFIETRSDAVRHIERAGSMR